MVRFEKLRNELFNDGWEEAPDDRPNRVDTTLTAEIAKVILSRNESPDIGFDRSINPYRRCEHGCTYCFARPTHAYLGLSPGLDFETKLYFKPNAAKLQAPSPLFDDFGSAVVSAPPARTHEML